MSEAAYERLIGKETARSLVRNEVMRLVYTSDDMKGFAEDMGFSGKPFAWKAEDRRHSRARLDAIYFILYGLSKDDADYILDTFPIVRRQDEEIFGRHETKELTLAYMAAFEVGDTESKIVLG